MRTLTYITGSLATFSFLPFGVNGADVSEYKEKMEKIIKENQSTDFENIAADWRKVGEDIRTSLKIIKEDEKK